MTVRQHRKNCIYVASLLYDLDIYSEEFYDYLVLPKCVVKLDILHAKR
ncbi:hypothetical protein [Flavobacterium piscinae]|nr:hypothetical protein [Flavobacterium piscinae]